MVHVFCVISFKDANTCLPIMQKKWRGQLVDSAADNIPMNNQGKKEKKHEKITSPPPLPSIIREKPNLKIQTTLHCLPPKVGSTKIPFSVDAAISSSDYYFL